MGIRRKAREMVLQTMYQSEFAGNDVADAFKLLRKNFEFNKKAIPYAKILIKGLSDYREEIDGVILQFAANWRLERMSAIDRNIIRIAVLEMRFLKEAPPSVAINEAIEIARRFSTDDSCSFINGILDAVNKSAQ